VGWLFVAPTVLVLGLFLFIPIVMALWVSFSDWSGRGSPFSGSVGFVGLSNYEQLFTEEGGLTRQDFMTSLRNNFYFVLAVVPAQTALALFLAVVLNQQLLKAKSFFRTAFYFPSVTSSSPSASSSCSCSPAAGPSTACCPSSASTDRPGSRTPAACCTCWVMSSGSGASMLRRRR
jgi:ABC-type sugar transport system permease subunit